MAVSRERCNGWLLRAREELFESFCRGAMAKGSARSSVEFGSNFEEPFRAGDAEFVGVLVRAAPPRLGAAPDREVRDARLARTGSSREQL